VNAETPPDPKPADLVPPDERNVHEPVGPPQDLETLGKLLALGKRVPSLDHLLD
jgi:hypothetical protein